MVIKFDRMIAVSAGWVALGGINADPTAAVAGPT
jgi:hypothetical protein